MKPFVVNELVVMSGGVSLRITVFGNPLRRSTAFGIARWPVIARDALHNFLSQTWPSIKFRRVGVPRGNDERAW
ncbi:MAG: hypothetical protein UU95_C0004G0005 [Parcubacteria group bacterium GW2011_GWC2_42_12]|uniref:Uncharacterized protein n=1 Tax=Candidatus Falkowbacteria bacterium GW2011_GWA2_41_14 TaxID=1618635 RepID=A0A0G0XUR7_9BACT|nr:MAG: hypothetical protein UU43_C0003G0005 [Candidatus Falkowbacteria bacterium GW2011_GWA2_41_14]KKS35122.1 MAG: hypothetical protein UU95_C0004G0005 [Parcubacteria group bacterium GW2011_GWC2_42_12]